MVWKHTVQAKSFDAHVPLAEMFRYATVLRSATQGTWYLHDGIDHYEDVPKIGTEEIIKKLRWQT